MAPAVVTVHSPSSNAGSADASKIAVQRRLLKASNEDATLLNGASAGEQEHGSTPPPGKTKASESETNGAPGPERQSDVAAESKLPEESKDGATDNQKHSSAEGEKADGSVYSDDPDDPDDPDGLDDEDLDDDDVKIEDVELVENAPKRWTKKLTERRKRRLEMFSKWWKKEEKEIEIEAAQAPREIDEEKLSAKALITSHSHIISDPREYQLELFEVAKIRNTIAVLDTGSGKTLIACLLIRYMYSQELENRARGLSRRVSFFLVHSVTLVFQQASVLACNLDAKIGKYCGDILSGQNLWAKEQWSRILDDEPIITMTADVLYNCLSHGFIKMTDVNLLCFDECHHAKKNHVYARIIQDFYLNEPPQNRPKVFGMTASPVDARVDVVDAALSLEQLLDSRITTTSDLMLLQSSLNRPVERVAPYPPGPTPHQTPLCKLLWSKYKELEPLQKLFTFAANCNSELGAWCADQCWAFALSEIEAHKLERKAEKIRNQEIDQEGIRMREAEILKVREARKFISSYTFPEPKGNLDDTSQKLILLANFLRQTYQRETEGAEETKCIIFVTRRYTARVMYEFLLRMGSPHMKLGILIGSRTGLAGDEKFTFRQQMLTVSRFRHGKLNCIIATSVAEEGLDIPDCSLVIRFDLYSTMIQYIQSRGRARHSRSTYVHFCEVNNLEHTQILNEVRQAETYMRKFCETLPEDRLLNSLEDCLQPDDGPDKVYIEPGTGAKLTHSSAMQMISHYVANLPNDNTDDIAKPTYIVRPNGRGMYICELLLPSNAAFMSIEGTAMPQKPAAKRTAAFEACLQLRKKGHLNEYLMPKLRTREMPKMANAHLAVDINRTNTYNARNKPSFWTVKDPTPPTELWITIMYLSDPDQIQQGQEIQPMCIATRNRMPHMPAFPVYSDKGGMSEVVLLHLDKPLSITGDYLELMNTFTIRVFYDVFNKLFELDYGKIPYWLAPVKTGAYSEESFAVDTLDWAQMRYTSSTVDLIWDDNTPIETFINRFFVDRICRSRRFAIHGWDATLTPGDPVPEYGATAPGITSIRDYTYNAGKKGGKWRWVKWNIPKAEPVLIADRVLHRLNYLEPPSEKEINTQTAAYICPSAFSVSMIPLRLVYMSLVFPAISTRIDAYLHAWDVCKIVGLPDLNLKYALESVTKDADNTHEHGTDAVNQQKGMGQNYERLEFLGDCYLKMSTSISLYTAAQGDDEFKLHVNRMVLVCNQHLFEKAKILNIPEYIQTQGFSRRYWYPALTLLSGKGTGKEVQQQNLTHKLGDKSIADVCEALIGAALLDKGLDGATRMVTNILMSKDHTQKQWPDYYKKYKKPTYQLTAPSATQVKLAQDIESQFGYKFKSPRLLMSAFCHSSNPYSWEKVPCYQRLEFLGDSLLDLACVLYIFHKHPDADPQWLTEHKMAMVSNKFLGVVSVVLGFHRKMRRVGQHLDMQIRDFETEVQQARESNEAADFWTSLNAAPKCLPDVLEAFIGALFVDSEFSYEVVEKFFDDHIKPYFVDMTLYDSFAGQHPTTFLTKRLTDMGCENWGFEGGQHRTEEDSFIVSVVMIHEQILASGRGLSTKNARVAAAEAAIAKLDKMKFAEFSRICTCKEDHLAKENGAKRTVDGTPVVSDK